MTTIHVNQPAGGRARFRHRTPSEALGHYTVEEIPGSIELPPVPESDYYQVTLRRQANDGGQWSETFAIQPQGDGPYDLEDEEALPRMSLGEAAGGGFALGERVSALEAQVAQNTDELGGAVYARLEAHEAALEVTEGALMPISPWSGVTTRMDYVPGYGPVSDLDAGTYTASGPAASAGGVRLQLVVRTHGQEATVALSAGSWSASSALPASDRWHLVQLDAPAGSGASTVQVQAQGRVLLGWPVIGTGIDRSP